MTTSMGRCSVGKGGEGHNAEWRKMFFDPFSASSPHLFLLSEWRDWTEYICYTLK